MNIAAAAIKIARADEKQRPIAEVSEVKSDFRSSEKQYKSKDCGKQERFGRRDISERSGRPSLSSSGGSKRRGDGSHEEGMIRMKLNKGKMHGVRPSDIVGTIAFHANIPGFTIGKIRIEEKLTFVDIPEDAGGAGDEAEWQLPRWERKSHVDESAVKVKLRVSNSEFYIDLLGLAGWTI